GRGMAMSVKADSSSSSYVTMDLTRLFFSDGNTMISSPLRTTPDASVPQKPRKFRLGRLTYCTGKRRSLRLRFLAISTVSNRDINVGPSYHGICSLGLTTLSPLSADMGMK